MEVALRSIQRLPTFEHLACAGVACSAEAHADSGEAIVVLSSKGWSEPVRHRLPLRGLRAGVQDVTFRVAQLGQVCVTLQYAPIDAALDESSDYAHTASKLDWGDPNDDGVATNVEAIRTLLDDQGISPVNARARGSFAHPTVGPRAV